LRKELAVETAESSNGARLAPVEARVRDNDFDASDEQGEKAESSYPVRHAD